MSQRKTQARRVNSAKEPHHGIAFFAMQSAANQECAKHRHEADSNDRRADHRESFSKRQRMKQFSFHAGQSEDRNERENNDRHCEKDRPPDKPRSAERNVANL